MIHLTIGEASRQTGIAYHTIYSAVRTGRLASKQVSPRIRLIDPDDLETWLSSRKKSVEEKGRE